MNLIIAYLEGSLVLHVLFEVEGAVPDGLRLLGLTLLVCQLNRVLDVGVQEVASEMSHLC